MPQTGLNWLQADREFREPMVVLVNSDGSSATGIIASQIAPLLLKDAEDPEAERALQQARGLLTANADAYFTRQVLEDASASLNVLGPPESLS